MNAKFKLSIEQATFHLRSCLGCFIVTQDSVLSENRPFGGDLGQCDRVQYLLCYSRFCVGKEDALDDGPGAKQSVVGRSCGFLSRR